MPNLDDLLGRLAASAPGVRRVAILDLIGLSAADGRATVALLRHLPSETDEKSALAIIRHIARIGHQDARPLLWQLYQDPTTPARIAHAAIVAHDHLVGLAKAGPLESARGDHPDDHGDEH